MATLPWESLARDTKEGAVCPSYIGNPGFSTGGLPIGITASQASQAARAPGSIHPAVPASHRTPATAEAQDHADSQVDYHKPKVQLIA
jgi:hypothetical protein